MAGRPDSAILTFERGLQYDPESADLHYHLGLALASKNRIDEAKTEFDKALEINPKDANAHFALGVALASQGDGDAAIDRVSRSAAPESPKRIDPRQPRGGAQGEGRL